MDDKNKIKKLEIQIDNLITEKHIKERNSELLKLQKKKEDDKLINDTINLLGNKSYTRRMNIIDIVLGVSLIIFIITDLKKLCSLNIIIFLIIIIMLICISIFNESKFNILGFIKILLGMCLIALLYFDKTEYFDFYVFKIIVCLVGLYVIYNGFSNNSNNIKIKKDFLPDYRKKYYINNFSHKDKLQLYKKKYEGGEFQGCVNIDNINSNEAENKLFYKGNIYDLANLIIDTKTLMEKYKTVKNTETNINYDDIIKKTHIYYECLLLLSELKKTNQNGDLVILLEIIINEQKTYTDLDENLEKYTKTDISEIINLISDNKYNVGSICFNNMSI